MPSRARQMAVEPASDRGESRMCQVSFKQPADPWQVDEVTRLAVAPPQSREDAEDLAIALSRKDGRRAQERRPIERRKSSKIALGHPPAQLGWNIAPGVFEERYEIVTRRPAYGVLKIEEPATLHPRAIRQQHQVVDMVVAEHQGVVGQRRLRQKRPPQIEILLAPSLGERLSEGRRSIPIDQQRRLGEEPLGVVGGQVRRPARLDRALQRDQRVYRQGIEVRLVGAAVEKAGISVVAEILDQQKTARTVFREHIGGTE